MNTDLLIQYNKIKTNIENVYNKIEEKEGTLPENKNSQNLVNSLKTVKTRN